MIENVTNGLLSEEILKDSEEAYRLLFNNSEDMIFVHEPNTNFITVNYAACQRLGYSYEELCSLKPSQIINQQSIEEGSLVMERLLADKHALFEVIVITKNQTEILVEMNSHFFIFQGKQTILSIARDITHRKLVEENLRRSEARFRQIFTNAPIGIFFANLDGQLLQVNQTLCDLLGYSEAELKTRRFQEFTYLADQDREALLHQRLLRGEVSSYKLEKRYVKSNGETIWVMATRSLLQDPDSKQIGILAMVENITERFAIDQMKDNFISIVSHEMRTPLTSIRGALGLLATGKLGTLAADGEELLNIALLESQRLVRLVSDILDLERLRSGYLTLVKENCDLADLMWKAFHSIKALAETERITVEVTPLTYKVWVDSDRIIQALTNLLNNAIKFSPAHSQIWFRAEPRDRQDQLAPGQSPFILITVKDQGRGIPLDKLETIFEPFEQVDASDSRQKGGTGMGLAICRSIVKQHGGEVWATSQLEVGSCFLIMLPIFIKGM